MVNTRFSHWLALALAVALAGLSALTALGSFVNIFSAGHGGVSLQAAITTAVIALVLLIAGVRWAVHAEHRLRTPGAAPARASTRRVPARQRRRLHHHRQGPVAVTIAGALFTLAGLGMLTGAVQSFGAWRLSGYVQSHGTLVPATVMGVHDIEHSSRSGDWYTAEVAVVLHRPVDGATTATVHDPTAAAVIPGETVTVRADPQRPGYAEFPGKPYGSAGAWIALAVFGPFMLLISGVYWAELAARIRERRQVARLLAGPTSA